MICEGDGQKHTTINENIVAVLVVSKAVDLEVNAGKLSVYILMSYRQNSGRNHNLKR